MLSAPRNFFASIKLESIVNTNEESQVIEEANDKFNVTAGQYYVLIDLEENGYLVESFFEFDDHGDVKSPASFALRLAESKSPLCQVVLNLCQEVQQDDFRGMYVNRAPDEERYLIQSDWKERGQISAQLAFEKSGEKWAFRGENWPEVGAEFPRNTEVPTPGKILVYDLGTEDVFGTTTKNASAPALRSGAIFAEELKLQGSKGNPTIDNLLPARINLVTYIPGDSAATIQAEHLAGNFVEDSIMLWLGNGVSVTGGLELQECMSGKLKFCDSEFEGKSTNEGGREFIVVRGNNRVASIRDIEPSQLMTSTFSALHFLHCPHAQGRFEIGGDQGSRIKMVLTYPASASRLIRLRYEDSARSVSKVARKTVLSGPITPGDSTPEIIVEIVPEAEAVLLYLAAVESLSTETDRERVVVIGRRSRYARYLRV